MSNGKTYNSTKYSRAVNDAAKVEDPIKLLRARLILSTTETLQFGCGTLGTTVHVMPFQPQKEVADFHPEAFVH